MLYPYILMPGTYQEHYVLRRELMTHKFMKPGDLLTTGNSLLYIDCKVSPYPTPSTALVIDLARVKGLKQSWNHQTFSVAAFVSSWRNLHSWHCSGGSDGSVQTGLFSYLGLDSYLPMSIVFAKWMHISRNLVEPTKQLTVLPMKSVKVWRSVAWYLVALMCVM